MGIWFPAVFLAVDERVRYEAVANSLGRWRAIGGQVTLTDRRLIFTPNWLDTITGASRREISLSAIEGVHILEPGVEGVKRSGLAASIHPQVKIADGTDSPLVLTVRDPDGLVSLLPS